MKKLLVRGSGLMALLLVTCYLLASFAYLLPVTNTAFAQGIGLNITKQGPKGITINQADVNNPDAIIGNVFKNSIALLFTVGGLGFLIMFIWGAVDWILSGGDKEKVAGARKRIVTAVTGLVLLALTFVITIVLGQILHLQDLRMFNFTIPKLL